MQDFTSSRSKTSPAADARLHQQPKQDFGFSCYQNFVCSSVKETDWSPDLFRQEIVASVFSYFSVQSCFFGAASSFWTTRHQGIIRAEDLKTNCCGTCKHCQVQYFVSFYNYCTISLQYLFFVDGYFGSWISEIVECSVEALLQTNVPLMGHSLNDWQIAMRRLRLYTAITGHCSFLFYKKFL